MGYASLVFAGFVLAYIVVHPFYEPVDVVLGMLAVFILVGAHFASPTGELFFGASSSPSLTAVVKKIR